MISNSSPFLWYRRERDEATKHTKSEKREIFFFRVVRDFRGHKMGMGMSTLFAYPEPAKFGRMLPKSKIYEYASTSTAVKNLFVRQVKQIVWQFKLAPETVNLKGTPSVPEIQIFSIALKGGELKTEALRCIDLAISFPIIFELQFDGKVKSIAAFKRPSEADAGKWVISEYFVSDWVKELTTENTEINKQNPSVPSVYSVVQRKPLPLVRDLGQLYEKILDGLMPYPARLGEDLQTRVERMERIRLKQHELERCEVRLRKEKQFNRKVAINAELRELKQELEGLIS
ncbi:DUF4391 domain-containing protein [Nitrosomonas mobilis]|uniref:Methyl-accepting chemotaxis protein n=1 Tax=Nitrosomonas mobilis TaxID=51642 RepID=A0A1G5SIL1_9PROT|nr:DUF4391 domain-containing protein [Nitrosomonas mobilis]SCZ87024.1 conserved hypothetical protein [Nitrosomonas mobilis]